MSEADETKQKYLQLEGELDGKWFAVKDKELLATADTNEELWLKLRALRIREPCIGYAPTKEEREAECLYAVLH